MSAALGKILTENAELVKLLAGIGNLVSAAPESTGEPAAGGPASNGRPAGSIAVVGSGFEAFVFIAEAADLVQLKQKFTREIEKDRKFIGVLEAKLANENFLKNAPPDLVDGEKLKLRETLKRTGKLESYIRAMA
jgi:valyl-tRNA synthetase